MTQLEEKYEELVDLLKELCDFDSFEMSDSEALKLNRLNKEISLLKSQEVQPSQDCTNCPSNQFYLANTERIMNQEDNHSEDMLDMVDTIKKEGKDAEIGSKIFEVLNAWVYNETNEAGDTLNVIDACDLPMIIPRIVESLSLPVKQSVTDDDIEKWIGDQNYSDHDAVVKYTIGLRDGAKAMRDGQIPKK